MLLCHRMRGVIAITYKGVDTAAKITRKQAQAFAENGISFIGRYLVDPKFGKALTDTEANGIRDAGLGILLIYETYATRAREGDAAGKQDGYAAYSYAKQIGIPDNCVIYFAVDYDAPRNDYDEIIQYLYAAKLACAPYRCGVYGKADLINSVKADAYMQCVAWSYGLVSNKADVYQYEWQGGAEAQELAKKVGVPVDMDMCDHFEKSGIWTPPEKKKWYSDAMAWAQRQGLIRDGRPDDPMTRAELATVLYRIFGPEDDKKDSGLLS